MDKLTKKDRSNLMKRIRGKDTRPEKIVRSLLHRRGFRFRLHDKKLPGKPDIVIRKYNTVIFVHGCYWHRHKECKRAFVPATNKEFWQEKFRKNIERDNKNESELRTLGWKTFVIWECEIMKAPKASVERVINIFSKNQ